MNQNEKELGLKGFSILLLKQYATQLDLPGQDYARRIGEAAARMDRLILDWLDYLSYE